MQRNVSPVVAIIVILVIVAAVAFVWLKLTAGEKPTMTPGAPGGRSRVGAQRETREGATTERGRRSGRRGSRRGAGEEAPAGTTPGATEAGGGGAGG